MQTVPAEEYIAGIPMWTREKNSLSDIRKFLSALDVSEDNIIHVAGTNGKGSVCAYLGAILKASGFHVGTFVSPHLTDVKERFLIDGEPVCGEDLQEAFEIVLTVVEDKRKEGLLHPSYFEFCFLIAMELFTRKEVDFRILETGLGGRLDATNAVRRPVACVITSISLDHTQYLGDTIEEIAAEKAGIIKPNVPVIFDASDMEAAGVIEKRAESLEAPAYPICPDPSALYQEVNAALVVETIRVLKPEGVNAHTVREGLLAMRWQGRMEEIRPGIWLDGAHNPGGMAAFIKMVLSQQYTDGPFGVNILFAVAGDKDYRSMIRLLCEGLSLSSVTVTAFEGERAAPADELAGLFMDEGCRNVKAVSDPYEALSSAMAQMTKEEDRLYIIGSLYLIGALRPRLL